MRGGENGRSRVNWTQIRFLFAKEKRRGGVSASYLSFSGIAGFLSCSRSLTLFASFPPPSTGRCLKWYGPERAGPAPEREAPGPFKTAGVRDGRPVHFDHQLRCGLPRGGAGET